MKTRTTFFLLFAAAALTIAAAQSNIIPSGPPGPAALVQPANTFNSQTSGAANTAVTVTIAAANFQRGALYSLAARCSAGSASLTVKDGATDIFSTQAGAVTTSNFNPQWHTPLAASLNADLVITLSTCGAGNTGTLSVQASRF